MQRDLSLVTAPPWRRRWVWTAVAAGVAAGFQDAALAQTAPPDAGALLRQIEPAVRPTLPPRGAEPSEVAVPPASSATATATVTVKSFRFAGNHLLDDDRLARTLVAFTDRPLTIVELETAAQTVASTYRDAGWVARAFVPAQDITGDDVTIQVIEATVGATQVAGEAKRVSPQHLRAIVSRALPAGSTLSLNSLDRALLLIEDLPGVDVASRLAEGLNDTQTDIVLSVTDKALLTGDVEIDNTGPRSTGSDRALATARLESPLGLADLGAGVVMHSSGSDYVRGAYTLPVGYAGGRMGVSSSYFTYHVVAPEFAALEPQGSSKTLGVEATYPLVRSPLRNVYLSLTLDDKRFDNRSAGITTSQYSVRSFGASTSSNLFDDWGGGGASNLFIGFEQGNVDLAGSANETADAKGLHTAGRFSKIAYTLSRQQVLSESMALFASVGGQMASKNLDSAERFYLGGIGGVRAYPQSEASGSLGNLVNVEVRARVASGINLVGFYDWGAVTQNRRNDGPSAATLNRFALQGVGASASWVSAFGLTMKLTLARRLGSNPNPTPNGRDSDGSLHRSRAWLQASVPF